MKAKWILIVVGAALVVVGTSLSVHAETQEEFYARIHSLRKVDGEYEQAAQEALAFLEMYPEKDMFRQKIYYEYAAALFQQEKFDDIRKTPILGDLPLIGALFRTVDKGISNRELVVFITPRIMTGPEEVDEQMAKPIRTLEQIERSINPGGQEDK